MNEQDEEDDFYDAKGDQEILQHVQSEIQIFDETQQLAMQTCREEVPSLNRE